MTENAVYTLVPSLRVLVDTLLELGWKSEFVHRRSIHEFHFRFVDNHKRSWNLLVDFSPDRVAPCRPREFPGEDEVLVEAMAHITFNGCTFFTPTPLPLEVEDRILATGDWRFLLRGEHAPGTFWALRRADAC